MVRTWVLAAAEGIEMPGEISFLSIGAAAIYGVVVVACLAAGTAATGAAINGTAHPPWHRWVWFGLAGLFMVLIAMRLTGFEEELRDAFRDSLRRSGSYQSRRSTQAIAASIILVVIGAGAFWWFYRATRVLRGRRNFAAMAALACGAAMAMLVLLRLISLHAIDKALHGPLKLNWFADLGTSLAVLLAGCWYVLVVRRGRK